MFTHSQEAGLERYAIAGKETDWDDALVGKKVPKSGMLSFDMKLLPTVALVSLIFAQWLELEWNPGMDQLVVTGWSANNWACSFVGLWCLDLSLIHI